MGGRVVQAEYARGNHLGRAALAFAAWEGAPPRRTMQYGSEAWRAGCTFAEAAPIFDLHRLAAVLKHLGGGAGGVWVGWRGAK